MKVIFALFTNRFIGQHDADELQHAGLGHVGILFAQDQHPVLSRAGGDPGGQLAALVGIAGADEVAQVVHHLAA